MVHDIQVMRHLGIALALLTPTAVLADVPPTGATLSGATPSFLLGPGTIGTTPIPPCYAHPEDCKQVYPASGEGQPPHLTCPTGQTVGLVVDNQTITAVCKPITTVYYTLKCVSEPQLKCTLEPK